MTYQEAIETIEANYPPEKYSMLREALDTALSVLKDKMPHVLTLEEADIRVDGWYWIEYKSYYVDRKFYDTQIYHLQCHAIYAYELFDFDAPTDYTSMFRDDYGRLWRCWSAKPTEEQRQKVRWDE